MDNDEAYKKLKKLIPSLKIDEVAVNYLRELIKHYNKTQDFHILEQGMEIILTERNTETLQ